jgi:alpha-tubulin suppressor-like RCC1 family protein
VKLNWIGYFISFVSGLLLILVSFQNCAKLQPQNLDQVSIKNNDVIEPPLIQPPKPENISFFKKTFATGTGSTCILSSSGVLKCSGYNGTGGLGDGTKDTRSIPTEIDPGTTYSRVSSGVFHGCGLATTNVFKCWGTNSYGEFGSGQVTGGTVHQPHAISF